MATLTQTWELFTDLADAIRRFTSTATPPTLTLSQLIDDTLVVEPGATVTVWDSSTSALTNFDFLFLHAQTAGIEIELTCVSASGTRTFVLTLAADGFPLVLNDDTARFGFSDVNVGLITKVRAHAQDANTVNTLLRYAVGVA